MNTIETVIIIIAVIVIIKIFTKKVKAKTEEEIIPKIIPEIIPEIITQEDPCDRGCLQIITALRMITTPYAFESCMAQAKFMGYGDNESVLNEYEIAKERISKTELTNPIELSIWKCDSHGNPYESDQYGNIRNAPDCPNDSIWHCNEPKTGYETNQYGSSRLNKKCKKEEKMYHACTD